MRLLRITSISARKESRRQCTSASAMPSAKVICESPRAAKTAMLRLSTKSLAMRPGVVSALSERNKSLRPSGPASLPKGQ